MINKKGSTLLTEETIKIVLGIAIFIFFIMILVGVFKIFSNNNEKEKAKNTLEMIVYEMEHSEVGAVRSIIIEGPVDWIIFFENKSVCMIAEKDFFSERFDNSKVCVSSEKNAIYNFYGYKTCDSVLEGTSNYGNAIAIEVLIMETCFVNIDKVPKVFYFQSTNDYFYVYLSSSAYDLYSGQKDCFVEDVDVNITSPTNKAYNTLISINFSKCNLTNLEYATFSLVDENENVLPISSCSFFKSSMEKNKEIVVNKYTPNSMIFPCFFDIDLLISGEYKIEYELLWNFSEIKSGTSKLFNIKGVDRDSIDVCALKNIQIKKPYISFVLNGACENRIFMLDFDFFDEDDNIIPGKNTFSTESNSKGIVSFNIYEYMEYFPHVKSIGISIFDINNNLIGTKKVSYPNIEQ